MDMIPLKVSARLSSVRPKAMRRSGAVPCVVYGSDVTNVHVQCPEADLHRAFVKAGESTLVELDIDGKRVPVLFKDISFDPVSGRELHADFYAVDMKKEIETVVPIRFEGEAPAVKELGAVFVAAHDHVRVRCLPVDLPHDLPVSVMKLAAFHDVVTVAELTLPKGVTIMEKPDTVLATVQEPRKEEEIAPPTTAALEGEAAAAGAATAEGATAEGAAPAAGSSAGAEASTPAKAGKEKK